jgi:Flp pilus assembly protein TadG
MVMEEKGQSLVEFALTIPLFLLLLMGIVDFGRLLYSYSHLEFAAQETVRKGGLGSNDADMVSFARSYIHLPDPTKLSVTITPADTIRKSGDYVSVKLSYPFNPVMPLADRVFTNRFTITSSSTIRVE